MNRANQIRRNDTTPILSRLLYDIDLSIKTHLEQNIIPNVIHNNELLKVPIIYGTPEKWKSVQVDKFYRDDKGKAQYPLIMFKRTSEEKDRSKLRNVDANSPALHKDYITQYSSKNSYIHKSILNNQRDIPEIYRVITPDYITINYDAIIWTNMITQMNAIKEALIYAEGSYWGEKGKYQCYTVINSFSDSSELTDGEDRIIKSSFSMTVNSHIIPYPIQKQIQVESEKLMGTYKTFNNTNIQ